MDNKTYEFIGDLSIALNGKKIKISLTALKQILNDRGEKYSSNSNLGIGRSVSAAYNAWKIDPKVQEAIAHTFTGKNGKFAWED